MSNSGTISVAPEVAVVGALVTAIGVIITDIHDTDLPDVHDDIVTANAAIDAVGVIATAVQAKTDLLTLGFPGAIKSYGLSSTSSVFVELANLTSTSGEIILLFTGGHASSDTEIKLTLDAVVWNTYVFPSGSDNAYCFPDIAPYSDVLSLQSLTDPFFTNISFQDSCLIEVRSVSSQSTGYKAIIIEKS